MFQRDDGRELWIGVDRCWRRQIAAPSGFGPGAAMITPAAARAG